MWFTLTALGTTFYVDIGQNPFEYLVFQLDIENRKLESKEIIPLVKRATVPEGNITMVASKGLEGPFGDGVFGALSIEHYPINVGILEYGKNSRRVWILVGKQGMKMTIRPREEDPISKAICA